MLWRFRRSVARTLTEAPGALGEEMFHDAVLERMERDHRQTPLGFQNAFGRLESRLELTEFVVHRDAQGLKGACRGMDFLRAPSQHAFGDLGQFARPRDRPRSDDGG